MLNKILNFLVYDKKSKLYTKVLGWDFDRLSLTSGMILNMAVIQSLTKYEPVEAI